jgi:uncharacterized protein YjbI with pentapeptide repeats
LRKADLTGANLTGADLRGVNFDGANLKNAVLDVGWMHEAKTCQTILPDGNVSYRNCI